VNTTSIPRLTRADGLDPLVEAVEESGAAIIEDLVDRRTVAAILDEVDDHLRAADPDMVHVNDVLQTFYARVRNLTGLAGKSPTFVDAVLLHPLLLGAADAIIGPNCASFSLNVAQLMAREPGARQQWLHRDDDVWSFVPEPHPHLELSTVLALTDFRQENGATAVVPGSHRWEHDRRPEPHEVVHAEMPAGAGIVYLGSTIRAGGTNRTNRPRPGIHMSYVVGWLRSEENHCLAVPPRQARALPRRAQELIGYGMHDAAAVGGGYLGAVDLANPVDLLAAGTLG
jgi:ectoine hydroxylase-related dioxygenase (phytanoyl-CoA dioxygenase family)